MRQLGLGVLVAMGLSACGFSTHAAPTGDGGPVTPDAPATSATCGNGRVEPGEDCDNGSLGPDATCDATCHFTCGNGTVDLGFGETCDTAIAAGMPGACPTTCDDGQACTTDALTGSNCTAACVHGTITEPVDGDGCCPAGANANNDTDCTATCGNGILEAGETCDTGITAGAGACPTTCDDGQSCTTDTLTNPASCQAACTHTPITMPKNGDGCCPAGATSATDSDCLASCGNGVLDTGETCDTAITSGPGACPTACSDGNACTTDELENAGTCTAACAFPPITMPIDGDGCCPPGANANDDTDCKPVCGNGVVEAGEQCDDGNQVDNDACSNTCKLNASAYRFSTLALRDPHVFVGFFGCHDVTDTTLDGFSVNSKLATELTTDGDGDGQLDLSPTVVFRPLVQTNGSTTALDFYFASCTAPIGSTACKPGGAVATAFTATAATTGTCLAPIAGTLHPYAPAVTSATGPCFASQATASTITINVDGIPITLSDVRVAATFSGAPATQVVNGLLIGFMSVTTANATTLPSSLPLIGGEPLSELLAGGKNACPSYSDLDTDNGVAGWWFYLNFTAPKVPWSEM